MNKQYIGIGTIFYCYPRFVSEKTFLFPITKLNSNSKISASSVTAHELLHFIFFDYIEKTYGITGDSSKTKMDKNYAWQVSEAFNSIIEGWEPYQKIFDSKSHPYPEALAVYKKMKKNWDTYHDVDVMLKNIFDIQ